MTNIEASADFGEAAPLTGIYHEKTSNFLEHNLYPLRYNKAVADVTREITGNGAIYARSAWAGSQRYPLHWGGDAEITDGAMAGTLRGGLSLGLCGFSFWSHFIGGFSQTSPEDLYLRWLAFGALCSHSRCHGAPPTEPWEYGERFTEVFRRIVELRYRLIPYLYAQAALSSRDGYPMLRALFFEYPEDPTSWFIEDQYLLGTDVLVAPLMEEAPGRDVYLPPGRWIDYQDGSHYEGTRWHSMLAGELPVVMLIRDGSAIPHAEHGRDRLELARDQSVSRAGGGCGRTRLFAGGRRAACSAPRTRRRRLCSRRGRVAEQGSVEGCTFRLDGGSSRGRREREGASAFTCLNRSSRIVYRDPVGRARGG